MQETSFPVEILIHDDASTDGTDDIIRYYTARFPELVFPLYEEENQYSKPNHRHIDLYNFERARGKYIAYCEGDDYWTDPYKLHKQVDFLETHPDYSVCWHRCQRLYVKDDKLADDSCGGLLHDKEGIDIDIPTLLSGWYTQPLTMVFRRSSYDLEWSNRYKYFRDEHQMYHLLTVGKGYLMNFVGGVYVIHDGGVFGARDIQRKSRVSCAIAEELYRKNKNEYTKHFYGESLQWAVYQHVNEFFKKAGYSWKLFMLNGRVKLLIKNLLRK